MGAGQQQSARAGLGIEPAVGAGGILAGRTVVSFVPYRDSRRARRQPLDRGKIVQAALGLMDDLGLDELTMRRLAQRLGVKAASLYRHVRDKQELLVLLADEISGSIPLVEPRGEWRDQLRAQARNARQALARHRDAARLLAETAPFGPRRLRHIEAVLRSLRAAGLSRRNAARAAYHLNNFVTEFAADEARFKAGVAASGSSPAAVMAEAREFFRSLPADEYPTIVELADDLFDEDQDALFEYGVEAWIRALAASMEPPPGASRRQRR